MQIVVLGMHRSGTSAVTGMLVKMGAYFGQAETAMPPNFDNPRGFWERVDAMHLNDRLLAASGADWMTPQLFRSGKIPAEVEIESHAAIGEIVADLSAHPVAVIKDPRMCITADHWIPEFSDPVCLLVLRNPLAIARSLQSRNRLTISVGLAMWEVYIRGAVRALQGHKRLVLDYDALMENPREQFAHLCDELRSLSGGTYPPETSQLNVIREIDAGMRHHTISRDELARVATAPQLALSDALVNGEFDRIGTEPDSEASLNTLTEFSQGEHRLRKATEHLAEAANQARAVLDDLGNRVEIRSALNASRSVRGHGNSPENIRETADRVAAARDACLNILGIGNGGRAA